MRRSQNLPFGITVTYHLKESIRRARIVVSGEDLIHFFRTDIVGNCCEMQWVRRAPELPDDAMNRQLGKEDVSHLSGSVA